MKRIAVLAPLALIAIACTTSTQDFKKETEAFLKDDSNVESQLGVDITEASCEEPPDKETGTQYTCEGTDVDGANWTFTVEITGDNEFTVIGAENDS
jgi:hypothetical protein